MHKDKKYYREISMLYCTSLIAFNGARIRRTINTIVELIVSTLLK